MKDTLKKTVLLSSLVLFSIPSFAKSESKIDSFTNKLNQAIEKNLNERLKRNKTSFKVEIKKVNNEFKLTAPSYINRETIFSLKLNDQKEITKITGKLLNESEYKLVEKTCQSVYHYCDLDIDTFPFKNIKEDYAIANKKPFANLFVKPSLKEGDNLATQVRIGNTFKILDYSPDKKFAKVQSLNDNYISWINRNNLLEVNESKLNDWTKAKKAILTKDIKKDNIHLGTELKYSNGKFELPNGKIIKDLNKDDYIYSSEINSFPNDLIKVAKQFLPKGNYGRITYLWGGTSGNKLDCSGYTQTVYQMNGISLPRDADQQQNFLQTVAKTIKNKNELKVGDLIFFSGNKIYATHVGIYIGNNEFIHSSPKGDYSGVKINSLIGKTAYDKTLQGLYFGGGRLKK